MTNKLVLAFVVSLLAYAALAGEKRQLSEAEKCQMGRITASQPSEGFMSEGGRTEFWNQEEDQFQCAGVASMKETIQPNALSLPKFFPAPRLIYVEQGKGVLGTSYPGCPETYYTKQQFSRGQREMRGDQYQKVHRVRRGEIIAILPGALHWLYNDGNKELVTVSVINLNSENNQLDLNLRGFMLAGGQPGQGSGASRMRTQKTFQNFFRAFDEQLLAEAFQVPTNLVKKMQRDNKKGTIVQCEEKMRLTPEEEEEGQYGEMEMQQNGLEETICTMKVKQNIDIRREADVHIRQAGRINIANQQKLPILESLDMSAERGLLMPNAIYAPHWSMTDQRVVYALRGELLLQLVDDNGDAIMNERVKQGDMFVIPQFFATMGRAGRDGFEWVTFKTSSQPMKSPLAGYTSVMRAMPIEVITNSFQCSPGEAQQLKRNRDPQSMLFSPTRTS